MRLIYPADVFRRKSVDEVYADEFDVAQSAGHQVSVFSFEDFLSGRFRPYPDPEQGDSILYRGWMLTPKDYLQLHSSLVPFGAKPVTSVTAYTLCHHLPEWYPLLSEFTAETRIYPECADLASELKDVGWNGCFLKDYVKSLSTDGTSIVRFFDSIPAVVAKMRKYRGSIEGGFCARQIEDYETGSERRYFVWQGEPFGDNGIVPEIVALAAERIASPFFTIDVARRSDGVLRIIELGDGQVSDRKHWTCEKFISILTSTPIDARACSIPSGPSYC